MLVEIQSEAFKQNIAGNLVARGKITFHNGLNTIVGDKKAENSIGKSTFLLIIDFCFGGDFYADIKNCNVVSFVGNHKINFAFKFGNSIEYYSRSTLNPGIVVVCNKDYTETNTQLSIQEFTEHLRNQYQIKTAENSFRSIVGRFARIYGRKNYSEQEPLQYGNESTAAAIKALEQLYGVYDLIRNAEEFYTDEKKKKKVRKDGIEVGVIAPIAKTKKEVKDNEEKINCLTSELEEVTAKQDQFVSTQDTANWDQAAIIKGQITILKRRRSRLISQQNTITNNLDGANIPTEEDISELQEYFPNINLEKLVAVEKFHKKLQAILAVEMAGELEKLKSEIFSISTEIDELECKQRALGVPTHISKKFLQKVVELDRDIHTLQLQNQGYQETKKLDASIKTAKAQLESAREVQLCKIQAIINQEMVRLNDFIYCKTRHAPEIKFSSARSGNPAYKFGCDWDAGTGENYKNLIIFDLSVLATSELPILIHDSLLFKNIGDSPIEKIMELYQNSSKQIFISFDKKEAFSEATKKILEASRVIELHDNGGELFGKSWAKKR